MSNNIKDTLSFKSSKKRDVSKQVKCVLCKNGYRFWGLYFRDDELIDVEQTLCKIVAFASYIAGNNFNFTEIEDSRVFTIDLHHLQTNNDFLDSWKHFREELKATAEYCLKCIAVAMHEEIYKQHPINPLQLEQGEASCPIFPIAPRLTNYEPILSIKTLKVNYYGKLVSVRGTVIRASSVKLSCQRLEFRCSCDVTQVIEQTDGAYTVPSTCKCRKVSGFVPLFDSRFTRTVHCQSIKLQELVQLDSGEGGRVPRTLECELANDLVNSCIPGDEVTVTGVIKVRNTDESNSRNRQKASLFLLYLDTVSIVNNKSQAQVNAGCEHGIQFSNKDYYAFQKIHAEPKLFRFLVQSLCPHIYGHEVVKAGLLLALFGGTVSEKEGYHRVNSHVLMVGDPGLGKSQMLQACTNVAPKGVYVCGNTSTTSGLTVTMCRETGGEYVLEAGALVLGDQGICCIDEFDKMTAQHACLLEAMEQQMISIAKAGVTCALPSRTTILAAANPVGGHYSKGKTVSENLRMNSALLSRFDLVFILLDQPNEKLDSLLSEHVLALHCGSNMNRSLSQTTIVDSIVQPDTSISLRERLQLSQDEEPLSLLPHVLFRKYIAYARQYVHPKLTPEAKQTIIHFYLELRKEYQTGDCTPVTTRQLESLIRLTQARAKLELRDSATEQDAIDVIEVMRHSLVDVFTDEYGTLDFRRSQNGSGMSSRNQMKSFISVLQRKAERETKAVFKVTELQTVADQIGIARNKFSSIMQTLNIQGFLLKKGPDVYQLRSVDFS